MLIAHAWHHRSDAYSSLVTLLGIGGAMMGIRYSFALPLLFLSFFFFLSSYYSSLSTYSSPRLRLLDPLAGLAVSGMIMHTGTPKNPLPFSVIYLLLYLFIYLLLCRVTKFIFSVQAWDV